MMQIGDIFAADMMRTLYVELWRIIFLGYKSLTDRAALFQRDDHPSCIESRERSLLVYRQMFNISLALFSSLYKRKEKDCLGWT
jgi:hypothetical protein